MRRMGFALAGLLAVLGQGMRAYGQDTVDALEKDLQDIKQNHQEATAQTLTNLSTQLQAASQSPDAAMALYVSSGGQVPPGAPVSSAYAHETPTEKAARESQDAAKLATLAVVAQVHCGLMLYASQFVVTPDKKGLREEWIAWLKSAAQVYMQITDDGLKQTRDLRKTPVKDSVISNSLGFGNSWGDKEQGGWSVAGMPGLYRAQVLEPLRVTPTVETLAAWDVYIAMKGAHQQDPTKWTQVEMPSLQFERACDDYAISHSMDKLQALHDVLKANSAHPKFDEMLARMHDLVQDYRKLHPGAATPGSPTATASNAPSTDPNVKVTTTHEGDMTIITTTTNAASATPPPPPAQ